MSAITGDTVSRRTRWAPMLFIGLGTALIIMDATIVNVSLPSIIRELEITSVIAAQGDIWLTCWDLRG